MAKEGFIYLHRKLIDWEWYDDANAMRLFIHCLLEANFIDKQWHGITIKRGSFITSQPKLAYRLKLSVQQIRTALNKLKSTGELTVYKTADYSIISINNYDDYQRNNSLNNSLVTVYQQSNNSLSTTTNNDNNDKNDKNNIIVIGETKKTKIFIKPTVEEIKNYCLERKNNIDANSFFDYYESKGWMIGKNKMKDWMAAIRTWERNHNDYSRDKQEEAPIDYENAPYNPYR